MKTKRFPLTLEMVMWLNEQMKAKKLRQFNIIKKTGLSQTVVSSTFRGESKFITVDGWDKLVGVLGSPPKEIDPYAHTIDAKKLAAEIKKMKTATKASWSSVGASLGTCAGTLHALMRGDNMDPRTLLKLQEGMQAMLGRVDKAKPKGLVVAPKPSKVMKTKNPESVSFAKRSVIEKAPEAKLPTALELDLRELELIQRLRQHVAEPNKSMLNGHAKRA